MVTAVICMVVVMVSCDESQLTELKAGHADSLIFAEGAKMHYDHMLKMTDSLEQAGDISPLIANRWRGVYYYRQNQYRMAELYYRKVLDGKIESTQDQLSYNKSVRRLSELLLVRGDFEGSLQIAIPAVEKMKESGIGSDIDYAILLNNIGCCQLNLGQDQEAKESFLSARNHYANRLKTDKSGRGVQEAVTGAMYTSQAYIITRHYAEAIYWIDRTETLLNQYRQNPNARVDYFVDYFDEYEGRIEIMRAVAMQGQNKTEEAEQSYRNFLQTAYSKTGPGRINANDYLVAAHRFREAANNYRSLDKTLKDWGMELSLDNIQLYMLPKYKSNKEAGRRDSARVMGTRILSLLDSAITGQKKSSMAELATIYDTNEKEAEITRQRTEMTRLQFISMLVALSLIVIFLSVYTWNKRKSARRLQAAHENLADAHAKLQVAYNQLEETTAAKERIESEVRIAHDIQMSMVPSIFPNRQGLDLFAYISPARGVGGDLYDYLLQDDTLYFCLGDVSGKGVPASLFMAQAIRLFRAIAKQRQSPATIATRINSELTEDNEQGMFVTMFIGMIDLKTGQMAYCNAGHNPPVFDRQFMEVESNAPIGLWPELEYVGETLENVKGKSLFLYTDGLNEAENRQQEQFGDERLLDFLCQGHFSSARQVIELMVSEVEKHRDGAEPSDDLTMLCLKINEEI